MVGIQQRQGLARLRVLGGGREGRAEGVVEVAALAPVARVARDVEEGAVELEELAGGVLGALGEVCHVSSASQKHKKHDIDTGWWLTIHVLRQAQEVLDIVRQRRQRPVRRVRLRAQAHVPPVPVEQPDEPRVGVEGARRREGRGVVVAPEPAGAAKSGQAGGGREAGPTEREDAPAAAEGGVEAVHVVVRCGRLGDVLAGWWWLLLSLRCCWFLWLWRRGARGGRCGVVHG